MADYHLSIENVEDIVDVIAASQNPKLDAIMEMFGEIAREAEAGRAIIIAVDLE